MSDKKLLPPPCISFDRRLTSGQTAKFRLRRRFCRIYTKQKMRKLNFEILVMNGNIFRLLIAKRGIIPFYFRPNISVPRIYAL